VRLFVAIDLDDQARQAIGRLQQRVAKAVEPRRPLRWVEPAQMHLTLVFLGEVPEDVAGRLISAMAPRIETPTFDAVVQRLGVFPESGGPRVLWVGISSGVDDVISVQQEVAARCARVGTELEGRPFHPHLTLGRWRTNERTRRADAIGAMAADPLDPIARLTVDHVTLYRSVLSSAGSTYTALARANLT
jgi:2'-5' RNA ligase